MNKKQWQDIYKILNEIRSEFLLNYPTYKNGKNKAIRKEAEYKIDNAISSADYHVQKNWEVYELFTGGPNVSDYGRAVIYEEFTRPHYFGGDVTKLLNQIEEKINSLKSSLNKKLPLTHVWRNCEICCKFTFTFRKKYFLNGK